MRSTAFLIPVWAWWRLWAVNSLFPGGFTFQRAEEYCANLEKKMEHFSGYRPPAREKEKQLPEDGEHSAE